MNECRQFRVHGRVQGVFYRASARRKGQALGLTGWVRNCADGSVEVLACGAPSALDALASWLRQGPEEARVTQVESTAVEESPPARFEIR